MGVTLWTPELVWQKNKRMTELKHYLEDGANYNARAVMCLLQGRLPEIEERFRQPKIARWENCREQGYVIMVKNSGYSKQLNIAWFEHRNSDGICAIKWEEHTMNSPTIDTAKFGDTVYKDKYDVSHSVRYNECYQMAEWIRDEIKSFLEETEKKEETNLE